MKLEDVIIEDKKERTGFLSGLSDMLAIDISIGLNDDEFTVDYMDSYLEKRSVENQSGVLYSARKVARYKRIATTLVILGMGVFSLVYGPSVYYTASAHFGVDNTSKNILETAELSEQEMRSAADKDVEKYEPPFDPNLPESNMLFIPTAGIETEIHEAVYDDHEDALRKGVWRVSYSGSPSEQKDPIILAAHRYGYLKWSIPYRLKNSFYNLPKAELGDKVEIVWRQRKYVYEIYAEEESEEPSDFSADLILYTCKDLSSPVRIFMYAKLVRV